MPTWLIWVIVAVVVLAVVLAVVAMMSKRRAEQRRVRAEELRREASAQASGLTESEREAEEARAKAELAKAEARKAEERAATAEQGHQVEQASYEDKLREADRLDPEVNHRAKDYEPDVWHDERTTAPTTAEQETQGGSHRATPAAGPAGTTSDTAATTPDDPTTGSTTTGSTTTGSTTSEDPSPTTRTRPTE